MRSTVFGASGRRREKVEQLARQRGAALDGLAHALDDAPAPVGVHRLVEQVHAARNRHQQVVEVVGDAARQLADGFHLLGLAQGAFRRCQPFLVLEPLGHVVDELVGADSPALAVVQRLNFIS